MEFDELGYLSPYKVIETNLETFERIFVSNFENSDTRKKLFQNYVSYINDFKNQISDNFYQWIDGSFVTSKLNPNDIDIVTFLNADIYQDKISQLADFQGIKLKTEQKLDCYFVKEYPVEHKNYEIITHYDSVEWFHLFSKSRVQRDGKRHSKGIIQINF
jgi:hypothetical protein